MGLGVESLVRWSGGQSGSFSLHGYHHYFFARSVNTSNNKSLQQKVYTSKTCQVHLSTYGSLTRTNKENDLHKLTDSLNNYV